MGTITLFKGIITLFKMGVNALSWIILAISLIYLAHFYWGLYCESVYKNRNAYIVSEAHSAL
jgi:hypothetical protein